MINKHTVIIIQDYEDQEILAVIQVNKNDYHAVSSEILDAKIDWQQLEDSDFLINYLFERIDKLNVKYEIVNNQQLYV